MDGRTLWEFCFHFLVSKALQENKTEVKFKDVDDLIIKVSKYLTLNSDWGVIIEHVWNHKKLNKQ